MKITNKQQFYALWRQGLLGNQPRVWADVKALVRSKYIGCVTMRSTGAAGSRTRYNVPVQQAINEAWPGATFNESMPDDVLIMQGEAAQRPGGLVLTYSMTPGLPMRKAMERPLTATGLSALSLLRHSADPHTMLDIEAIFDLYPDAVIEFGAYGRKLGTLPHRNTIIWEVRDY
jgi:hypothetical protein